MMVALNERANFHSPFMSGRHMFMLWQFPNLERWRCTMMLEHAHPLFVIICLSWPVKKKTSVSHVWATDMQPGDADLFG